MAEKEAKLIITLKDMVSSGLGKIGKGVGDLMNKYLHIRTAVLDFANAMLVPFKAYGESREAITKLDISLKNLGYTTGEASLRLQAQAKALSESTIFSDEAIMSMQSLLATYGFNEAAITKISPKITDMASRMGIDLNSAAMSVGKSIQNDVTRPLMSMGVLVDETKFKSNAFGAVMDSLTTNFDGFGKAIAKEPLGRMKQLENSYDELMEAMGELISGQGVGVIDLLKNITQYFTENKTTIGTVINAIVYFGSTCYEVLKMVVDHVINMGFAWANVGNGLLLIAQGQFKKGFETIKTSVKDLVANEKTDFNSFASNVTANYNMMIEKNKALVADQQITKDAKIGILNQGLTEEAAVHKMSQDEIEKYEELKTKWALDTEQQITALKKDQSEQRIQIDKIESQNDIKYDQLTSEEKKKNMVDTLNFISSLSSSHNKALNVIGKAAAISMAIINTHQAATVALKSAPPPWNFALAAAVVTAGMANVAKIKAQKVAQGGLFMPRAGGHLVNIAEAGQPEAVIPLGDKRAQSMLGGDGGNRATINIYAGTIVADNYSIKQFAEKIDKAIFEMQRNRQSVLY